MKIVAKSFTTPLFARIPVFLALAVLVLSLLATAGLWRHERQQADHSLAAEFAFEVRQASRRIEQRMATYEQVARGTQAYLLGSLDTRPEDFWLFVKSLRLQEKYPGIQGLALIELIPKSELAAHTCRIKEQGFPEYEVRPIGNRYQYYSIIQTEPFEGSNLRALGYDMLTDPIRRSAMERARDTGQASASGKFTLVQENSDQRQSGLVMYLPVYKRGASTSHVEYCVRASGRDRFEGNSCSIMSGGLCFSLQTA